MSVQPFAEDAAAKGAGGEAGFAIGAYALDLASVGGTEEVVPTIPARDPHRRAYFYAVLSVGGQIDIGFRLWVEGHRVHCGIIC